MHVGVRCTLQMRVYVHALPAQQKRGSNEQLEVQTNTGKSRAEKCEPPAIICSKSVLDVLSVNTY